MGDRLAFLPSPTEHVTALAFWQGRLLVGGMDGAWVGAESGWRALSTSGEETTSLAILGDRLAVTTATGAYFVEPRRGTGL